MAEKYQDNDEFTSSEIGVLRRTDMSISSQIYKRGLEYLDKVTPYEEVQDNFPVLQVINTRSRKI